MWREQSERETQNTEIFRRGVRHLHIGKVDLTWLSSILWRTTALRSPMASAEPSSEVKRFCWTATIKQGQRTSRM